MLVSSVNYARRKMCRGQEEEEEDRDESWTNVCVAWIFFTWPTYSTSNLPRAKRKHNEKRRKLSEEVNMSRIYYSNFQHPTLRVYSSISIFRMHFTIAYCISVLIATILSRSLSLFIFPSPFTMSDCLDSNECASAVEDEVVEKH